MHFNVGSNNLQKLLCMIVFLVRFASKSNERTVDRNNERVCKKILHRTGHMRITVINYGIILIY